MIAKIYRGTNEIGGTCLELTAKNGKRLWVDIGSPLEEVNPDISYVNNPVDALLISHPHQDHYGLMENVGTKIPIYIGEISLDFINAVKLFLDKPIFDGSFQLIKAWQQFEVLETFKVTPYLTDHSTPESFAFLIEADGCRVFYSGDFRATGRKKILFDKLLEKPPKDIDYLFMEGTMIERSNHLYTTEKSVEDAFVEIFQKQENVSFVISSAQNIDRFVSIYNACKKTGKTVIIDPYTAWLLDKLSKVSASIPVMERAEIKVYDHPFQTSRVKQFKEFYAKIQQNIIGNVFNKPSNYVYFSRNVNINFFDTLKSRGKVNVIYSQWEGYLKEEFKQYFTNNINKLKLDKKHVNYFSIHTSGHAVLSDLKKYAKAINAKHIIPIHTAVPEAFQKEFQKDGISTVKLWEDGKEYVLNQNQMKENRELLLAKIKGELTKARIQLPKNILFYYENDQLNIHLMEQGVISNMQEDDSAFEGWALTLKRWGNLSKVIVTWEKPVSTETGHYQRFLFRVKNFSLDFKKWFFIDKKCESFLEDLKIKEGETYFMNTPQKRKETEFVENGKTESDLEKRFVNGDLTAFLKQKTDSKCLFRQLPTGVFQNKITKENSIFTGGKSAIDIWGFNTQGELVIFELKKSGNVKVGIISELYFYTSVIRMIKDGIFKYNEGKNSYDYHKIKDIKKIHAYFLAPKFHPLIDQKVIELLNIDDDNIKYHKLEFTIP